jgi:hypothetical protein
VFGPVIYDGPLALRASLPFTPSSQRAIMPITHPMAATTAIHAIGRHAARGPQATRSPNTVNPGPKDVERTLSGPTRISKSPFELRLIIFDSFYLGFCNHSPWRENVVFNPSLRYPRSSCTVS